MAKVTISNVDVRDNPCTFKHTFQFEITFECAEDLSEDLEWKLIYVGSAESEQYDQVLDTIAVGPVIAGKHMFVFETGAPNISKIPKSEIVGVTVVLLTCYYRQQEFIRVGYYVNNEYNDPELKENPPTEPIFDKLQRNILATCPRVTRFKIDWGSPQSSDQPSTSSNGLAANIENVNPLDASSNSMSLSALEGTHDSLLSMPSLDPSVKTFDAYDKPSNVLVSVTNGNCAASLDSFPVPPRNQAEPMQM